MKIAAQNLRRMKMKMQKINQTRVKVKMMRMQRVRKIKVMKVGTVRNKNLQGSLKMISLTLITIMDQMEC
jgi:hypothetical protein